MQSNDYSKFRSESRLEPMNPKGVMYVVPSGSRNVLARSLELEHQGAESLIRIRYMRRRKIDALAGIITDKDTPSLSHSRIVLNAAEIGIGAEIIDRSKKVRGDKKSLCINHGKYIC